jgi:hypothetical protein
MEEGATKDQVACPLEADKAHDRTAKTGASALSMEISLHLFISRDKIFDCDLPA